MISRRDFLKLSGILGFTELLAWKCPPLAHAGRASADEYDAIIIGSGLGGLSCAALLARNGFRPLVIEKHHKAGGYATSFTRSGGGVSFPCEVSLHATAGTPQLAALLEQFGVSDKVTLLPYEHSWYSVYPNFAISLPVCDFDCLEQVLAGHFPHEAAGLSGYMTTWKNLLSDMENLLRSPLFPLAIPSRYPTLWSMLNKTLAQLQAEYIQDERLKAVLSQSWAYYGLPPSQVPAWYYLLPTGQYYTCGPFYIQGTSQSLSNALVEVIRNGGGEVVLGTKVTEIVVSGEKAAGVKTEDGQTYYSRAVVSNASAAQTFGELLPASAVPADYLQKLSTCRPSLSTFIVWLGLNQDITEIIPWGSCSVYSGYDGDQAYQGALAADLGKAGFGATVYNKVAPGISPPGCSSVTLITMSGYEPWKQFERDYFAGNKSAYEEHKNFMAAQLINHAEAYLLPGLSEMVVMMDAATPLTNVRYTLNTRGAIVGYDQTLDNSGPTRLKNRTPVKGLYLSSAWSFPGGGYEAVLLGGKYTFRNLVVDWLKDWLQVSS